MDETLQPFLDLLQSLVVQHGRTPTVLLVFAVWFIAQALKVFWDVLELGLQRLLPEGVAYRVHWLGTLLTVWLAGIVAAVYAPGSPTPTWRSAWVEGTAFAVFSMLLHAKLLYILDDKLPWLRRASDCKVARRNGEEA